MIFFLVKSLFFKVTKVKHIYERKFRKCRKYFKTKNEHLLPILDSKHHEDRDPVCFAHYCILGPRQCLSHSKNSKFYLMDDSIN